MDKASHRFKQGVEQGKVGMKSVEAGLVGPRLCKLHHHLPSSISPTFFPQSDLSVSDSKSS